MIHIRIYLFKGNITICYFFIKTISIYLPRMPANAYDSIKKDIRILSGYI